MNDEMTAVREPQVSEWINRLGNTTEKALQTQQMLSQRLSPILRDEPMACKDTGESKEQALVPHAGCLREICRMVERVVSENDRLLRMLEI